VIKQTYFIGHENAVVIVAEFFILTFSSDSVIAQGSHEHGIIYDTEEPQYYH